MHTFGQVVMLWRIHKELTQAQLAGRMGISRPNLSRIESDKHDVSLKTIRTFAVALDVTPGTLVDGHLPGRVTGGAKKFSRNELERIAQKVSTRQKLSSPQEREIADNLRAVIAPRLRAMNKEYKSPAKIGAKTNRAWLKLCRLPMEERDSLIQRAIEHATIIKQNDH